MTKNKYMDNPYITSSQMVLYAISFITIQVMHVYTNNLASKYLNIFFVTLYWFENDKAW